MSFYSVILWWLIDDFYRWTYALILMIDANFWLKLKAKGYMSDLALGDGWAYWVELAPFQQYVVLYGHQVEVGLDTFLVFTFHGLLFSLTYVILISKRLITLQNPMPIQCSNGAEWEVWSVAITRWFTRMAWGL